MTGAFGALGFTVEPFDNFRALVQRAVQEGEAFETPYGSYIRWAPGAGIELWAQVDLQGEVIGCHPHFAGPSRVAVQVLKMVWDDPTPLDGYIQVEAELGSFLFQCNVPDFARIRGHLECPARATLQLAAFAYSLACYATDADWYAARRHEEGEEDAPVFSLESFVPLGPVEPLGRSDPKVSEALLSGHVEYAELRRNPIAGGPLLLP